MHLRGSFKSFFVRFYKLCGYKIFGAWVENEIGKNIHYSKEWTQATILDEVDKQLRKKIDEKKCKRKVNLKRLFMRFYKLCGYRLFRESALHNGNIEKNIQTFDLGVDELGRDVLEGMLSYVGLLKRRGLNVHTVLVLGSRAKGRWKPESDVDALVVASNLPKVNYERWFVLSDRPIYLDINSFGCTKREFMCLLRQFHLLVLDAIYYGKVVYDDGFWIEEKKKFKEIEKKYELQKTQLKQKILMI